MKADNSLGLWIAIGIALGTGIGSMMENVALGIAMGVGIGAALYIARRGSSENLNSRDKWIFCATAA